LKEVLTILDTMAPFESAEEWDNVGLMVGDPEREIRTIMVALDPSLKVIEEAKKTSVDLILTHHPLIFRPIKRFDTRDVAVKKISMLLESKINLVSMHTNLDKAPGGVADELAGVLGLKDVHSFDFLRTGFIEHPGNLHFWLRTIPMSYARVIDAGKKVHKVGVCPGSGMDFWPLAFREGCDTLVTGDVRYHAGAEALEAGMNVVDLGHFCSEEVIIRPLADRLRHSLNGLDVRAFQAADIFSLYHD